MPKFARDSEIDLQEAYDSAIDKSAVLMRNIRTKVNMRKTHHCEDRECGGGAPKIRCLTDLHFAFCLAPVVDGDPDSPTFGEVVIHGERFAVLSPEGCAEHQYTDEFNLDLKDARNGRAHCEVRWKKIFESFKAEHLAEKKREAEREAFEQKQQGMTKHQRRTMLARRDNDEYKQQQQLEAARKARSKQQCEEDQDGLCDVSQHETIPPVLRTVNNSSPEDAPNSDTKINEPDELALRIGAVADVDTNPDLSPMWLHDRLFLQHSDHQSSSTDMENWTDVILTQHIPPDIPVLSTSWLHNQLFPEVDASRANSQSGHGITSSMEDADSTQPVATFPGPSLRRKETKQLKKQRASQNRAFARTRAEDMETQEALDRTTKKASTKKTQGRTATTRFA